ncbi:MAG: hypothetical protein A3F33_00410 [Candidatus Woykebacteria bacterium RIFCSPHIGHO2_12_FULL_43_10]|uniref:Uncharacterized protein n=2 Tax=Candidatus Woykeibacteriota TaxID=1817899 RepID=A0A1G1WZN2_9BACT|nr:MAG: hypothetical protein A3J50_02095 [Candidatus Woykebacteria bacterium RIFCSPHIGHO2_02_FULL_43_16b]OGY28875.1 MAG: hypothetical protein A3F33_00410 [Candidatus Woykebacteria bacterium RIFCSPHIGHO2_12_FULL_43_10]OGY32597.1 MAG: hypothetical protein A3A61_03735 [Candidatus Woykebacteria bacterium RIFCSPLOWO2_01_FULL_43_14]
MDKTNLQVPISKELRNKAEKVALKQGFSSLQETVRIFLNKYASGNIAVSFEDQPVQLSPAAIKRYQKMDHDIESGKTKLKSFDSVEDLMNDLNS